MIAYITKYALTKGIYCTQIKIFDGSPSGMVEDLKHKGVYFHGNEWHLTWEDAEAEAQAMRDRKIISLNKQLDKLFALTFVKPE